MLEENKNETNTDMGSNSSNDISEGINDIDAMLSEDEELQEGEGATSLSELVSKDNTGKYIKILSVLAWVFGIILITVFSVNYFFKLSLSNKVLTGYDKDYVDLVNKYIIKNISKSNGEQLDKKGTEKSRIDSMKKYIDNKSVFFYNKKDSVKNFLIKEKQHFKQGMNTIQNTKNILINYKFLPKELDGVVKDIKLTPILLTLNSIKLYILDSVYIKSGKFDKMILSEIKNSSAFSNLLNSSSKLSSKILSKSIMIDIMKLRELGARDYLNNMVFNYMYVDTKEDTFGKDYSTNEFLSNHKTVLYERCKRIYGSKCDINSIYGVKDAKDLTQDDIDTVLKFNSDYILLLSKVYKKTFNIFNDTVDQNSLPVEINLLNYDPGSQILSFNVKISLKTGNDKVTVIGLATDIITLLRESRLIIGKDINFDSLKVDKVTTRGLEGKQTYDTTNLIFKTSVQDEVNVEVTDVKK